MRGAEEIADRSGGHGEGRREGNGAVPAGEGGREGVTAGDFMRRRQLGLPPGSSSGRGMFSLASLWVEVMQGANTSRCRALPLDIRFQDFLPFGLYLDIMPEYPGSIPNATKQVKSGYSVLEPPEYPIPRLKANIQTKR
jgi:hypothetical protein